MVLLSEDDVSGYTSVICFYGEKCVCVVVQDVERSNSFLIGESLNKISVVFDRHSDQYTLKVDKIRIFDGYENLFLLTDFKFVMENCVTCLQRRNYNMF